MKIYLVWSYNDDLNLLSLPKNEDRPKEEDVSGKEFRKEIQLCCTGNFVLDVGLGVAILEN